MGKVISINGQSYEVTNWDVFEKKILKGIGFQTENEMRNMTDRMALVDTGEYKRSFHSEVKTEGLIITNTAPHAIYLEYGTYEYFDIYGLDDFPTTMDPKKTKDFDIGKLSRSSVKSRMTLSDFIKGAKSFKRKLTAKNILRQAIKFILKSSKKNKSSKSTRRDSLPKGMQPFAVMRRVLWNKNKMHKIINNAIRAKFHSE